MAETKKSNRKKTTEKAQSIKKKKTTTSKAVKKKSVRSSKTVKPKAKPKKSTATISLQPAKKTVATGKSRSLKSKAILPEEPALTAEKPAEKTVLEQSLELADRIARLMFEKKAENIVILDLSNLTSVMDCFIIASGTSDIHVRAIADHVIDKLETDGIRLHHKEGFESQKWILLDYVDVVVHIFQNETREYYGLERLWGDARMIKMEDRL